MTTEVHVRDYGLTIELDEEKRANPATAVQKREHTVEENSDGGGNGVAHPG